MFPLQSLAQAGGGAYTEQMLRKYPCDPWTLPYVKAAQVEAGVGREWGVVGEAFCRQEERAGPGSECPRVMPSWLLAWLVLPLSLWRLGDSKSLKGHSQSLPAARFCVPPPQCPLLLSQPLHWKGVGQGKAPVCFSGFSSLCPLRVKRHLKTFLEEEEGCAEQ